MRESRSNIERHADGTVTRKARRYTEKKAWMVYEEFSNSSFVDLVNPDKLFL